MVRATVLLGRGSHRKRRVVTAVAAVSLAGLIGVPAAAAQTSAGALRAAPPSSCPWVTSTAPIAQRVAQLMGQMSLSQKISMVEGHGTSNPYVFYTPAISSLCIPAVGMEDGPAGVADGLTGVTQLPAGATLAATWDPSLAQQYGQVIGAEEFGKGASINLGPTVNIDRDPRWGRSFEALSEDPFLNSALDVPEINAVQAQDVMSQVKHFDAYNQETYRNTSADNVIVDNRALQEIYMPSFDAAVTQANSASVMCAYSWVNGNASCNNSFLNNTVLRDQWGFPGFVTSDYGALHSTQGALQGTDQEQPENTYYGTALQTAIKKGTIPLSALNTMVQRVLTEMFQYNLFNQPRTGSPSATVTTPADVAVATSVAEEGTTLLKNAGSALPLSATNGGTIAVIGPSASVSPTYAGGGSAYVIPSSTVTPLAGIQAAAGSGTNVTYSQGLPADTSLPAIPSSNLSPAYSSTPSGGSYTGTLTAPTTGTYVLAITNPCNCYTPTYLSLNGQRIIDDPSTPPVHTYSVAVSLTAGQTYTLSISGQSSQLLWGTPTALAPSISAAVTAAQSASAAVVVVSDDTESEAADRPSLNLPSAQDELISAVAAANPHTIVVIDAGAPVAMPWLSQVAGVLDAWYPGQTSGTSLASVLFGQTNPSGHLPVTFPASLSQMPTSSPAQFPGNGSTVQYSEGIDVGYRGYDAGNLTPLFPFGFGLSYTTFSFSNLQISPASGNGTENVAGDRDGHQHRHARGKRRRAALPWGPVRRRRAAAATRRVPARVAGRRPIGAGVVHHHAAAGVLVERLGERLVADRGNLQRLCGRLLGRVRPAAVGLVHDGGHPGRSPGRDHRPVDHDAWAGVDSAGPADGQWRRDIAGRPARAAASARLDRDGRRPDELHVGRARHCPDRDLPGDTAQLRAQRERRRARHGHDGLHDAGGRRHRHCVLTGSRMAPALPGHCSLRQPTGSPRAAERLGR